MEVTTKELRIQPGRIIEQAANGQEITVTYRGKALAKIVPFKNEGEAADNDESSIFGLWKDHTDKEHVENHVRELRKGRQF